MQGFDEAFGEVFAALGMKCLVTGIDVFIYQPDLFHSFEYLSVADTKPIRNRFDAGSYESHHDLIP